ncbi:MAG: hypothetical protein ACI9QC_000811 [Oceanicoccus sp.]|jgi:hypothetical protein
MKKLKKAHLIIGVLTLTWIIALIAFEDIRLIPCEAFADDVGYMSIACSVQDLVENLGTDDVYLKAQGYIMALFLFIGVPGVGIWAIKHR